MLNISSNKSISIPSELSNSKSGKRVFQNKYYKNFNRFLLAFSIIIIILLFLPWTQTISSNGVITTLSLDQRPQTIQSSIPGRIEEWYIREGDYVKKGDTILRISEIKIDYFDPYLVQRTKDQKDAKELSALSYKEKAKALERQISALKNERKIKLKQAKNKLYQVKLKVKSDSIRFEAAKTNFNIVKKQYERTVTLHKEGFKATKDVENVRMKFQETEAKIISQENKLLSSKNEYIISEVEISRIHISFTNKISKVQSEKYTAQSSRFSVEAQVSKLETKHSNYIKRTSLLFITAPQDGFINKAITGGIGITFKEGEPLVGIMPINIDFAVETFINPIDLPLIHIGEKVRVQFDGWPAIVFSGWPNVSYGTYGAKVVAVENFISENGKFRILLAPDEDDYEWPKAVRVGSGAKTIALLENVPIWFELWRNLNGFPPNYYQPQKNLKTIKQ